MEVTDTIALCQIDDFLLRIRDAFLEAARAPGAQDCLQRELEAVLSASGGRRRPASSQQKTRKRESVGKASKTGCGKARPPKAKAPAARSAGGSSQRGGGSARRTSDAARGSDGCERLSPSNDLESAARAGSEFLDVASHELRTPLTALQLQLQGLERQLASAPPGAFTTPVQFASRLASATRLAERLTELITGLFEASEETSRPPILHCTPVDLADVALSACEKVRAAAARRGCVLTLDAPHPVHGHWDAPGLSRVFSLLLSNALKYAPGAPVTVRVVAEGDTAWLSVSDRGMGIPNDRLPTIFERFERAVPSSSFGGLGLGLFVARRIVEAHGGRISVESTEGEGACFHIRIPRNGAAGRCEQCEDVRREPKSTSRHDVLAQRSQAG